MRLAFMGTPAFAVPALRCLNEQHEVAAVYTQPPRPARRGRKAQRSAIHEAAEKMGLEVRTPASLKPADTREEFAALDLDAAVVAAYGLILPRPILDAPRRGCLNIHASLLPRWRGAAPVQRAILAGDRVTGITIMQMEAGLDTGPMLLTRPVEIDRKTSGVLTGELAEAGARLCAEALANLDAIVPSPQLQAEATYAAKIDKAETRIDWRDDAAQIERQVRAFNPAPGAWFEAAGERVKLLDADVVGGSGSPGSVVDGGRRILCGTGALRLRRLQRAGKRPCPTDEFLNGFDMPASLCPATA